MKRALIWFLLGGMTSGCGLSIPDFGKFGSCGELEDYLEDVRDELENQRGPSVALSADFAAGVGENNITNLQEEGVDEADAVKVSGNYLFVAGDTAIDILRTSDMALVSSVKHDGYLSNAELIISGDRLVLLGDSYQAASGMSSGGRFPIAKVFKVQGAQLTELATHQFTGYRSGIRAVNNKVIQVFTNGYYGEDMEGYLMGSTCSQVFHPGTSTRDLSSSRVVVIDLTEPSTVESLVVTGGVQHVYMSQQKLYLSYSNYSEEARTEIVRVGFGDGLQIVPESRGAVEGTVLGQWAFKELEDGNLAVAAHRTTSGGANDLTVLASRGQNLESIGAVTNLGLGESIRAVRYIGTMAYVVTFRQIDPLFAIDLTNPAAPTVLGELKIPGFSTYLHPVENGRLLGIGREVDESGIGSTALQLSLFDVSNPSAPSRLDHRLLGDGQTYSQGMADHHAFFFDNSSKRFGFPVRAANPVPDGAGGTRKFSGAVVYGVDGNQLVPEEKFTHWDLIPSGCLGDQYYEDGDITRLFRLGSRLITVSRHAVRTHRFGSGWGTLGTTTLSRSACETPPVYGGGLF